MTFRIFTAVCLSLLLGACAATQAGAPQLTPAARVSQPRTVILVSIDGFRRDYLERNLTPTLSSLAREGVLAQAMRPSFPSVTFPNHYTLVTGLRPDHHGIVNNFMTDAQIGGEPFSPEKATALDARWWNGAEPLWVSAEKAHVRSATMFWPGSTVAIRGVLPSDFVAYDKAMPYEQRVDRVLEWLGRTGETRPRFVTLYLEHVDSEGHAHGPDSAEVDAAIAETDKTIARLTDGLQRLGLAEATDLVIVSDHGMAALSPERTIDYDPYLASPKDGPAWRSSAFIALDETAARDGADPLLMNYDHFKCWRKGELPERFHFGKNARIPAIFCMADVGWLFFSKSHSEGRAVGVGGTHGYDPEAPEMAALFVANGPSFRSGVSVAPFDNVDVYPLLAQLLHIAPQPNDGNPATLSAILKGADGRQRRALTTATD